ncbi:MAG: phosphatase PAP2 family protein [Chloroflexi bacterium]|nr:phosphatase PAP2 family protein [Chloroflexota bacterium]MBI3168494.1 phosphatase PAP2 family protein [Chloroflexota bacterium]
MIFRRILELDARLSSQMRVAEKPGLLRNFAIFFAHSGDSWFWLAALIIVWFFSDPTWRKWETVEFFGILGLAFVVLAVKFLVKRKRPEGDWGEIYRNTDPHSFPSGHAARAFLVAIVATVLAPPWLAIILWVWAPLVSLARVSMGVHYLSDIIAGTILGVIVALLGLQFYPSLIDWFTGSTDFMFW